MAKKYIDLRKRYIGTSEDVKPTSDVPTGSFYFETDTRKTYIWDGADWKLGPYTLIDGGVF